MNSVLEPTKIHIHAKTIFVVTLWSTDGVGLLGYYTRVREPAPLK